MIQRQKDAVFSLGIVFSIKHPLFALLVRHSEWILNHLLRNDFIVEVDNRVIKTSPYRVTLEILLPNSTSFLNRILVGRRDDDDKQPRFQHAWFLGLIGGSDEVIALQPDGVQRHHGEWRVSPLDDPESKIARVESSSGSSDRMRLEVSWLQDTGADDARNDHEAKRHKDDALPMEQEPSSSSGVKRANVEAICRADAEAEKAVKRAKMLEERRAAKRASATPINELEESATNTEVTAESLMIAAEAILAEHVKQLRRSQSQLSNKLMK